MRLPIQKLNLLPLNFIRIPNVAISLYSSIIFLFENTNLFLGKKWRYFRKLPCLRLLFLAEHIQLYVCTPFRKLSMFAHRASNIGVLLNQITSAEGIGTAAVHSYFQRNCSKAKIAFLQRPPKKPEHFGFLASESDK